MNTKTKRNSNGFGIQRDITEDGAVIYLRITNPRRLNTGLLWSILRRHFAGGYNVLILDQGNGLRKRLSFAEFLAALKSTLEESQLLFLERKLIRDPSVPR
jgi:hypothetical protein